MYIGGGFGCNPGAGRRSAGLGDEGAARAISHAGGVRGARSRGSHGYVRKIPRSDEGTICQKWDAHYIDFFMIRNTLLH